MELNKCCQSISNKINVNNEAKEKDVAKLFHILSQEVQKSEESLKKRHISQDRCSD